MLKYLSATQVREAQSDASWPGVLLHLLPAEHFSQKHLPGAKTACVFETSFLDQVREAGAREDAPVILYDDGHLPYGLEAAAEKLAKAGFTDVSALSGGLGAWSRLGLPLEGDGAGTTSTDYSGRYTVNTAESVIRWTGRNLFNHHEGTLKLAAGHAQISGDSVTEAAFTVDMKTIACSDLVNSTYNAMLIKHLWDDDFFAVERFPNAEFWLTSAVPLPGARAGLPNYELTGLFRLRGVSEEIRFPAVIAPNGENRISAQAQFEIDRTRWGVLYGSSKFFNFLGKHVVNDHIHLHLKLHLDRA